MNSMKNNLIHFKYTKVNILYHPSISICILKSLWDASCSTGKIRKQFNLKLNSWAK